MMKNRIIFIILPFLAFFQSCDSGDIKEQSVSTADSGLTVKLSGVLTGVKSLNDAGYSIALAGFDDDENYAVVQRTISAGSDEELPVNMVMSNISDNVSTVEFVVTNTLRKRFISIRTLQMSDYEGNSPTDTIYLDVGTVDVSLYGALQNGMFDQACIMCHGANGRKAADMDLTSENSYEELVDRQSSCVSGAMRVSSGFPDSSLLYTILTDGGENILEYNHNEVITSQFKTNLAEVRTLLYEWIESLGEND